MERTATDAVNGAKNAGADQDKEPDAPLTVEERQAQEAEAQQIEDLDIRDPDGPKDDIDDGLSRDDADPDRAATDEGRTDRGGFSAELLDRAKDAGYTEEEAKAFGSPANLERAVTAIDRRLADIGNGSLSGAGGTGGEDASKAGGTGGDGGATDAATKKDGGGELPAGLKFEPFKVELDPEMAADPDVVRTITAMNEHYAKQLEPFVKHVQGLIELTGQRQNEELEARLDGHFDSLGDDYNEVFGKGEGVELLEKSERNDAKAKTALGNRQKVVSEMEALAAGYSQAGRRMPSEGQLFEKAVRLIFPEHAEKLTRRRITKNLKRTHLGRASTRTGDLPPGEQRAERAVADKLRNFGAGGGDVE